MDEKLGKHLLELSEKDSKICNLGNEQRAIISRRDSLQSELEALRNELIVKEAALTDATARQSIEDHRLKEEQAKIVERRKQIAVMSGAKVAKVMEREVEIAARSVQSLEEALAKAVAEVEGITKSASELKEKVAQTEQTIAAEEPEMAKRLAEIEGSLKSIRVERDKSFAELEPRLQRLYKRVQGRYPGSPVAVASKSSCRACYRALPQQTYNQIMAGYYLIQCPGCARILVYVPDNK